jgi:ATP-dependent Clp protease ATP-binding subunit ClpC
MSEYMEKFSVSRLIGAPPGYVGYEEGGQLTEKVRRKPYCVVLLDEIEKAHPDTFNILLQVLDDGILTDGLGRKVDFKNTILIMTSNIGTKDIKLDKVLGFGDSKMESDYQKIKSGIDEAVKRVFSPEFINRIDDLIVFRQLERESILKIVDINLNKLFTRLKAQHIELDITKQVKEFLSDKGFDQKFGARPLRRAIQKYLEDPLSEEILKGTIKEKSKIKVKIKKGSEEFIFSDITKNDNPEKDSSEEIIDEQKEKKG